MSKVIKDASVSIQPVTVSFKKKQTSERFLEAEGALDEEKKLLLDAAEAQKQQIIAQAQNEAASILQQSQQKGEALQLQMQDQGYREGLALAQKEGTEIRNQARKILQQAEVERKETLEAMEGEIVSLAVTIAEKYLATQLRLDPEIVVDTAKEALQLVRDREKIIFYVNKEDLSAYLGRKQELEGRLSDRATIRFIADDEIAPGGCLIDTEQGLVDATKEARWQEILQALQP